MLLGIIEELDTEMDVEEIEDPEMDVEMDEEVRKRPCKSGTKRNSDGKCVKLTASQKMALKKGKKALLIKAKKDKKDKAKLNCKPGYIAAKVDGKWKCVKTKECPDGSAYSVAKKKCQKVFKEA
jgi:hypothetical protein